LVLGAYAAKHRPATTVKARSLNRSIDITSGD
jgi:hypothetical protein